MDTQCHFRNGNIVKNVISSCQSTQFVQTMAFSRDSCSDNDSGICIDSGSEQSCSSPKCSLTNIPIERSRILPKVTSSATNVPTLIPSLKVRKESRSQSHSRCKPMRVRFADEVSADDNRCLNSSGDEIKLKSKIRPPPPYNDVVNRRLHQLNRDQQQSPSVDEYSNSDAYANLLRTKSSDLAKSVENLSLIPSYKLKQPNKNMFITTNNNCCQLAGSSSPSMKICGEHAHKNDNKSVNNTFSSKPKFAHSMTNALQKLNSNVHCVDNNQANLRLTINQEKDQQFVNRNVKARLLSIDSKGVHVVELQKSTSDGPFGFYISTGIFISRINVPNLNLLLNVGDQIIEIDNTLTKGRSLEQTQLMMFNKNRVVLKVLPVSS